MPVQDIRSFNTDALSPFAIEILKIHLEDAYTRLVVAGEANPEAKAKLEGATPDQLIVGEIRSREDACALLSGLWLWHDGLDESHRISQDLSSDTGSFWHAIMHRREGDFSNAKYWYARCAAHPVQAAMYQNAVGLINQLPADKRLLRLVNQSWSASAFVDLVQDAHRAGPGDPMQQAAVSLQQLEWRYLFDHCTRAAAGK